MPQGELRMKIVDIELAQKIIDDPQAVVRGYVNADVIKASNEIAKELINQPLFGTMGFLAEVGSPHQWWVENLSKYKEWSFYFDAGSYSGRRWKYVCELADYAIQNDKREKLESRWTSLELMRKSAGLNEVEDGEYLELSRVLKFPAKY
jgi:hypothetical protein